MNRLHKRQAAFALRDLCALILFGALPFALLRGPLSSRRFAGESLCLSNLQLLTRAWSLYSADSAGAFLENSHGSALSAGMPTPEHSPWAWGWEDWGTSTANTNLLYLRDERWSRMAPYISADRNVHKCPRDRFLSRAQIARHWKERVRSYSMNATIGRGNANVGALDAIYRQAPGEADLYDPSPAASMVFLEEHPDSINDPLAFPPFSSSWVDVPASFHDGAADFSFADGHAEIHAWTGPTRNFRVTAGLFRMPATRPGDPDIHYFSFHSQRRSSASY